MKINDEDHRALWADNNKIHFIDQRKLPFSIEIFTATSVEQIAYAIKTMVVRGAPAIGAAAAYGMALGSDQPEKTAHILKNTRPTAYDLFYAIKYMTQEIKKGKEPFIIAENYISDIIKRCRKIGEYGNKLINDNMNILTHCNAGALATIDCGTALAPLRKAHEQGKKIFVYADETRPRLQGLLTAWELHQEGIPYALIVDNAAGHYMQKGDIDIVITGTDRIAANGDFANKIGTYEKAVLAKENNIPFYIAAPISTYDPSIASKDYIQIEERNKDELTHPFGTTLMPEWIKVCNPAFDVTSRSFVTGYITENGIKKKISF